MTIDAKQENEREIVLAILLEVLEKDQFSHIVLRMALEKYSYLSGQERAFIARLARGCVERKIELDAAIGQVSSVPVKKMKPVIRNILRMAEYQLRYMKVPVHAVCNEAVRLAVRKGFSSLKGFVNANVRSLAKNLESSAHISDPTIAYSVPQWLYEALCSWYHAPVVHAYLQDTLREKEHSLTVHCHTGDCSMDILLERLKKQGVKAVPAPYARDCLLLSETGDIRKLEAFREGLIQVQDISSALAAQCVAPHPGSFCIDVCGAPGGKSIYLAKTAGNSVRVLCRDISFDKLELIRENQERCHADNMEIEQWDAAMPDEKNRERADYVLADVPCSGLGILGKKPDIKYHLTKQGLESLIVLQRQILIQAAKLVKPGGVLVYSTCTINPQENRENVQWFLQENPFELESLQPYITQEIEGQDLASGMLQLIPGQNQCDGFFIARMRRKNNI